MINVGMSTSCAYPQPTEHSFRLAKLAGFDGVEIMVTNDQDTQDPDALLALSARYNLPILSIHAPVLLLTHFVWGRDPRVKLEKSAELARAVGATTVVVHPPFRWQTGYSRDFLRIVRKTASHYGVEISIENMFPWTALGKTLKAYSPGYDPSLMDCDAITLDFSHASLAGRDSLDLAMAMGDRLHHVHLCDGSGSIEDGTVFDEHLVPGRGTQPVAEVLQYLVAKKWSGSIIAEVNTRKAKSEQERLELLRDTIDFARRHLGQTGRQRSTAPANPQVRSMLRRASLRAITALRPGAH
jgi:sugar phosphate isomerase/epimerase